MQTSSIGLNRGELCARHQELNKKIVQRAASENTWYEGGAERLVATNY